jgi:hypothetical protein
MADSIIKIEFDADAMLTACYGIMSEYFEGLVQQIYESDMDKAEIIEALNKAVNELQSQLAVVQVRQSLKK